jgi:hypothetical protein
MQIEMPDYGTKFDALSFSACYVELKGIGESRHATGFFWRRNAEIYLITNWHVVTGTNPLDGKSKGWCPESLRVSYFTKVEIQSDSLNILFPSFEFSLYEDFNSPLWLQHTMATEWGVDIVAIEVSSHIKDKSLVSCVNDRIYPRLYHFAGSDIFVIGHPRPRAHTKYPVVFPIWKRGSIASELVVAFDMRPAFLIDSRTSGGMSGSPVFARVFGPAAYADGTLKIDNILDSEFMGIYSGRLHDDENNASLGLVWHRNLIDQILDSPAPGSRIWKASTALEIFSDMKSASQV